MGMTIADNIDFLNEAKKLFEDIANEPSINETIKTYFIIESLESAITIMRKYQKIEQIVGEKGMPEWSYQRYMEIASIVRGYEDGNDNN